MRKILLKVIIFIFAVYLASKIVSGISFNGFLSLSVMGVIVTFAYSIIKPVLKIITLPLSILTFGLFSLILNAILFWVSGDIVSGFTVSTFVAAFWGSLVVSVVSGMLSVFVDKDND